MLRDLRREANPWTSKFPGQLNAMGGQQDCLGMTPLHIVACSTRQDIEVYRLLISKYPETLTVKDKWGDIPLLYAFWCNVSDEVIDLLAESYKSYHPEYEFDWRGVLLMLVKANTLLVNIQKLVSTQQTSFENQSFDMQSIVLELARSDANPYCLRYTRIETVRYLLSVSIAKRLEILNVDKWQLELEYSINTFPERALDRSKNATELYDRLAEYELAKESTTVLELTLWKLTIDKTATSNIVDQSSSKKAKIDNEISQRDKCRINCGADIIIPGVLRYLVPPSATTSDGAS